MQQLAYKQNYARFPRFGSPPIDGPSHTEVTVHWMTDIYQVVFVFHFAWKQSKQRRTAKYQTSCDRIRLVVGLSVHTRNISERHNDHRYCWWHNVLIKYTFSSINRTEPRSSIDIMLVYTRIATPNTTILFLNVIATVRATSSRSSFLIRAKWSRASDLTLLWLIRIKRLIQSSTFERQRHVRDSENLCSVFCVLRL